MIQTRLADPASWRQRSSQAAVLGREVLPAVPQELWVPEAEWADKKSGLGKAIIGRCRRAMSRLEKSLREYRQAGKAATMAQTTFDNVLRLCLATRKTAAYLDEVCLFDVRTDGARAREFVDQFITSLPNWSGDLGISYEGFSKEEKQWAEAYLESIGKRLSDAQTLRDEGIAALYDKRLAAVRGVEQAAQGASRCGNWFLTSEKRSRVEASAAGFIRTGYSWLLFRLSNLVSELKLEHGPFASALTGHRAIAWSTRLSVEDIHSLAMKELDAHHGGALLKCADRLHDHLKWFDREVLDPLGTEIGKMPPDKGPEDWRDLERDFREPAVALIDGLTRRLPTCVREIEGFSRQVEALYGNGQLSILLDRSTGEDGEELWVARALEFGVVGQGASMEAAAEAAANSAKWKREDLEAPEYDSALPRPAFFEDFEAFDALEENRFAFDNWREFSPVLVRVRSG
ncbi:MAG: hypothetical protein HQ582_23365 [Planctomycetes bacterium]|nr:hypothetical protein [Planctomycetota bacterium]